MKKWIVVVAVSVLEAVMIFSAFMWILQPYARYSLEEADLSRVVETGAEQTTQTVDLGSGSYKVSIGYASGQGKVTFSVAGRGAGRSAFAGYQNIELPEGKQATDLGLFLPWGAGEFHLIFYPDVPREFVITHITVEETNDFRLVCTAVLVGFLLVSDGLLYLIVKRKKIAFTRRQAAVCTVLLALVIFSSIPALTPGLPSGAGTGHDLYFHLMRIEGIANGIRGGQFPVRVQPGWLNGHGYGVSVFYPDTLLYLPAVMRLIGFPIQTVYKSYLLLINLLTCLVSGFCFGKILGSRKAALTASVLYMLSPYRLTDMYVRAAVGEYTAMVFLPFVLYGLFLIYSEHGENAWKGCLPVVAGLTGILQSHLLSFEITVLLTVLVCLFMWKKTAAPVRIKAVLGAFGVTFLLSLWFLVPFIDYMRDAWVVNSEAYLHSIREFGIPLRQLAALFPAAAGQSAGKALAAGDQTMTVTVGLAMIVGSAFYLVVRTGGKSGGDRYTGLGDICLALGGLTLWASTRWFPWDWIQNMSSLTSKLVQILQFPWRLMIATAVLFSVASGMAVRSVTRKGSSCLLAGGLCGLSLISAAYMFVYMEFRDGCMNPVTGVGSFSVMNGEYLPEGTDIEQLKTNWFSAQGKLEITDEEKNYNHAAAMCVNLSGTDGYLSVPLLYYRGYTAVGYDKAQSYRLMTDAGTDRCVRVRVPGFFSGRVEISYQTPWFWRAAEWISVLTAIMCLVTVGSKIYKIKV